MITEYRVILTVTFRGTTAEADRDAWYTAILDRARQAKTTLPAPNQAHITKDDYDIPDRSSEAV